tara:strand:- start:4017 stop:4298 length:282 start_codon:yes stop_codon:yes gene_type:complete
MEKKEYNGWYNYETWQCALWLDNDQYLYEAAKFCHNEEELQELVHDHLYEDMKSAASLATDIVNAWMTEVNYREIWENRYEELILEATVGETA